MQTLYRGQKTNEPDPEQGQKICRPCTGVKWDIRPNSEQEFRETLCRDPGPMTLFMSLSPLQVRPGVTTTKVAMQPPPRLVIYCWKIYTKRAIQCSGTVGQCKMGLLCLFKLLATGASIGGS